MTSSAVDVMLSVVSDAKKNDVMYVKVNVCCCFYLIQKKLNNFFFKFRNSNKLVVDALPFSASFCSGSHSSLNVSTLFTS